MTVIPGSNAVCDRCGTDVDNGGVAGCLVISDLDPNNPGRVRNLHFCRDRLVDNKVVEGCASKVFGLEALRWWADNACPKGGEFAPPGMGGRAPVPEPDNPIVDEEGARVEGSEAVIAARQQALQEADQLTAPEPPAKAPSRARKATSKSRE